MVQEIDVRDLARRLANGHPVCLIDVREPWEHATAALPGSVLIPLGALAVRHTEIRPPEAGLVVVYCHHGIRSRTAAALLEQLGIARVASLAGGIDAWSRRVDPETPRY